MTHNNRTRSTSRLAFELLEVRATPATAVYSALTQSLTINADQGDRILVEALVGEPAGYMKLTETQAPATIFDSSVADKPVRHLIVRFGAVQSGGLTLDANAVVAGNLTIYGARSAQSLDLLGTVGGNASYYASPFASFDEVNFAASAQVGGNLTINMSGGDNIARLKGGLIQGSLSLFGGNGSDLVQFTENGNLTTYGSIALNLGAGTNFTKGLGIANVIDVGANFTYLGGGGNDTFDLDGQGIALNGNGDVRFTLGNGRTFDVNVVKLEALRAGRHMTFIGGLGNDEIKISGAHSSGGNTTVALGGGDNVFDSNLLSMGTNYVGGNFTYIGGVNGDQVSLDAIVIGRSMSVNLGDSGGATQFLMAGTRIPSGVTVYGSVRVTGGSGVDSVLFRRSFIGGALTMNMRAGNDAVTFDDTDITGLTTLDLGVGDDLVNSEMLAGDGGGALSDPTTFGGRVLIKAGAGDDTFDISSAAGEVQFGSRLYLFGGVGNDTFKNDPVNIFKVTGNFNDFEVLVGTPLPV